MLMFRLLQFAKHSGNLPLPPSLQSASKNTVFEGPPQGLDDYCPSILQKKQDTLPYAAGAKGADVDLAAVYSQRCVFKKTKNINKNASIPIFK